MCGFDWRFLRFLFEDVVVVDVDDAGSALECDVLNSECGCSLDGCSTDTPSSIPKPAVHLLNCSMSILRQGTEYIAN